MENPLPTQQNRRRRAIIAMAIKHAKIVIPAKAGIY
jgi:hypothetical protein